MTVVVVVVVVVITNTYTLLKIPTGTVLSALHILAPLTLTTIL